MRLDFLRKHGSNLVFARELFQERSLLFLDLLLKFAVPRRLNLSLLEYHQSSIVPVRFRNPVRCPMRGAKHLGSMKPKSIVGKKSASLVVLKMRERVEGVVVS